MSSVQKERDEKFVAMLGSVCGAQVHGVSGLGEGPLRLQWSWESIS